MPGTARVMWIMARTACRRWLNQSAAVLSARFRKNKRAAPIATEDLGSAPKPVRVATQRKRRGSTLLLLFIGITFFWNGITLSSSFLAHLADKTASTDRVTVGAGGFKAITLTAHALPVIAQSPAPAERRAYKTRQWMDYLQTSLLRDLERYDDCEDRCEARAQALVRVFEEKGPAAFRVRTESYTMISADLWPAPEDQTRLLHALAAVLLLVAAAGLCMSLCKADLAPTEASLEWLFSFPIRARTLFLGRILESTLANAFTWFFYLPLLFTILWCSGRELWSLPLSILAAVYFALLVSCVQAVLGIFLRMHLSPQHLKNLQSLLIVVGSLLLGALLVSATRQTFMLDVFMRAPTELLWLPLSLPLLLSRGGAPLWMPALGMIVSAAVVPLIAMKLCERLVAGGLIASGGPYEGIRRQPRASAGSGSRTPAAFHGMLGKEVRLLLRDRAFLVQALFLPLFFVGLQVTLSPGVWQGLIENSRHAAASAFGVASFMLMSSALNALAFEGKALWLLYTFPQDLPHILRQKALLWCGVASLYCAAIIVVHLVYHPALSALPEIATAAIGVAIYSFIAAGLSVLGTDPLESAPHRVNVIIVYLFMFLCAMYAYAIYNPSVWGKLGQMVLSTLLAFALWQKVRDHSPYLLDPTEAPPPNISLADGMVAALAFFVVQGVAALLLLAGGSALATAAFVGFLAAGGLVGVFSLYVFWRRKVPDLLATVGLVRAKDATSVSLGRALYWGLVGGTAAGAVGLVYLRALGSLEFLRPLYEQAEQLSLERVELGGWWLPALAIFAAPVFEEYIFRGLVYRGLRRSLSPMLAIVACAGIFAIVHPAISAAPVFIMGAIAAFVYERTRLLIAPMVVHMIYNGIVLGAQSLM
jgi:membrane protease YdiL (CAAX protease family)